MGNLRNKLFRDIRQFKGQFIAITIVILIGTFFYTGFSNFARNLEDYADDYFTRSNLADLWLYYSEVSQEDINELEYIDGVRTAEGRTVLNVNQEINNLKTTLKVHSLTRQINKLTLLEGEIPEEYGSVAVDWDYAREHGIHTGDTVTLIIKNEYYPLTVSGLIENAEYTIKSRDTSDFPPNHQEYGIAYVSEMTSKNLFGITKYNEVLLDVDEIVPLDLVEKRVEAISEKNGSSYLYTLYREANLSYKQFTDEIAQQKEFSKILPVVFFVVAAMITYLTMSRIVDAQRTQIGVMKAMGASRRKITTHYLGFAVIVGLTGGVIGSLSGSYIFPKIFMEQVMAIISLPGFVIQIHYLFILQALILSVLFAALACYISVRKILRENAAQAMRAKPPKSVKRSLIERIPALWNRMDYSNKLIVRNIFFNKQRTIYSAAGIICCVSFLILAFGYKGSRAELIEKQFSEVYNYDLRVMFKEPIEQGTLPSSEGVQAASKMMQTEVVVTNLSDKRNLNLIALSSGDNCIHNYDEQGNLLRLDDTSVIISKRYAQTHNLDIGDTLKIKLIAPEYRGATFDVKIGGISVQYLNQDIYGTFTLLRDHGIDLGANTVLYRMHEGVSVQDLYNTFNTMDSVKEVKTRSDIRAATEDGLQNLFVMIIVIIVCAVVLSAAAIYNISVINIQERFRELATLKVLGCQQRRMNSLIFKENIIITLFSILVGIPVGVMLYIHILKAFTLDNMVFPVYVTADSILWPVAITLLVTVVCNFTLRRKTKRIDMTESLKINE
ncbi:FtsX-like permease family protein [Paenibacillus sp. D2_2]|uniref:ABC transporter permease n=1 Tax=Paenibacillus sp. D2_2 TaxID=3073092 RepID=UPI0028149E24|nr:FtsX-like permease family protein [Paenibacillus sp. D2_2]WMT39491.1 FtsX-like permease family protein [Paenibacillus sp. D2_2]